MKISIITVVLNNEKTIERAISSVLKQEYADIEHIVIDGGSTDNTLKILDKYKKDIDILKSEKDGGIYDAMNKGILLAKGDIIYFLNSDDKFFDKRVVSDFMKEIKKNEKYDYFYGGIVCNNIFGWKSKNIKMKAIPNLSIKFGHNIPHQSLFVRKELFDKIGLFNPEYRVNGDYEWECRLVKGGFSGLFIQRLVSFYDQNGFSSKISWDPYREKLFIIKSYFGLFYFFIFLFHSYLKYPLVFILSRLKLAGLVSMLINKIKRTSYDK